MDYAGDIPPKPEERATYRLAANAAWLARVKADDPNADWADKHMQRDNERALAAAKKDIESERKAHKCYICGRRDLTRYAWRFGVVGAVLLGLAAFSAGDGVCFFGGLGAAAVGAALGAWLHEFVEPDDEETLRKKFNATSHS